MTKAYKVYKVKQLRHVYNNTTKKFSPKRFQYVINIKISDKATKYPTKPERNRAVSFPLENPESRVYLVNLVCRTKANATLHKSNSLNNSIRSPTFGQYFVFWHSIPDPEHVPSTLFNRLTMLSVIRLNNDFCFCFSPVTRFA